MFCPECRSEYRSGFTECNDCQVALVDSLEPEPKPEYHEFTELMTVFSEVQMALIKAAFDETGLEYYFHGEYAHHLVPLPFSTRVMVRDDQVEEATRILKDLSLE